MQFNRGEWSELYALLELMDNPELNIVNNDLEIIDDSTFKILGLFIQNNNKEYYFDIKDINVDIINGNNIISNIEKSEIKKYKKILLDKIINELPSKGSFPIDEMKYILEKLTEGNKVKSSARVKEDINAKIQDNKVNKVVNKVGYSIKSSLGSPATLLNASNHTNFRYSIEGLKKEEIEEINNINTKTKLVDRMNFIKNKKAKIHFSNVISKKMNQNLQMIDYKLPEILADLLIISYETGEKNICKLLKKISKKNILGYTGLLEKYYKKKIGDFLLAVALGMMPGEDWNGEYNVKGGIILVENDGKILLLDNIYYKEYLIEYLMRNTKLESPSSSRFKMFDIYTEGEKNYFNLNLQIRFIK